MLLEKIRLEAIRRVDGYFARSGAGRRLENQNFLNDRKIFTAAWLSSVQVESYKIAVEVYVDENFPFSAPQVFLNSVDNFASHPHVEKNLRICFIEGHPSYAHQAPERIIEWVLTQVQKTFSSKQDEDKGAYIDEFQSHWNRQSAIQQSLILFTPTAKSRVIVCQFTPNLTVFAENKVALESWLTKQSFVNTKPTTTALFFWLNKPITHDSVPDTNIGFANFIKSISEDSYYLLTNAITSTTEKLAVVLAFQTKNGVAIASVILPAPKALVRGFRSRSTMPSGVLSTRFFDNTHLTKLAVFRFDKAWLDFRTGNDNSTNLNMTKVAVIGCGALGSHVIHLLARTGISSLLIFDNDKMSWENVGRHLLGAEYIGMNKAISMQRFLNKQLPHVEIKGFGETWQKVLSKESNIFSECDLVLSTTGEWSCDAPLNLLFKHNISMPPLMFGWLEEFGAAGQAMAITKSGACLACGMSPQGRFTSAATFFSENNSINSGACGDYFQPFGITELGPCADLVARLAVDVLIGKVPHSELRTWTGDLSILRKHGGIYSEQFKESIDSEVRPLSTYAREWTKNPDCRICIER